MHDQRAALLKSAMAPQLHALKNTIMGELMPVVTSILATCAKEKVDDPIDELIKGLRAAAEKLDAQSVSRGVGLQLLG